jgi:hypothetical protein|tara:strand:+ start:774 stop:1175 length:402 start_codon:yes stop_codon:yes gene_type:complete
MFYFDWKKVYDSVDGNISRCNLIMEMLIKKQIPRNKYDRIYQYSQKDYSGTSFLVHPDVLVYNAFRYPTADIAVYYALASLRSLPEYLVSQKVTLDLLHLPVDHDRIINNRLLRIEEDGIHFLYEEVTPENKH